MFIRTKKHNQIIKHKDKTIKNYSENILKLEKELEESKNLKSILEKLYPTTLAYDSNIATRLNYTSSGELILPDNVLVYVDDILGGKVIKQEGNKCLVIKENGDVETGLTKKKADKGYNYKLVRE